MAGGAAGMASAQRAGARAAGLRWLNLAHSFWRLAVVPANRAVTLLAAEHLLEVMEWRIAGKVSSSEFETILTTWLNQSAAPVPQRHQQSLTLSEFRHVLQERKYTESDLDIMIGMLLHEANRRVANIPVSYLPGAGGKPAKFEVCTPRWQTLSQELFFMLDTPAHGLLRFDEVFFLTAMLSLCSPS